MRQSLYAYCRQYRKLPLLDEWDAARNLPLTPQTVTYGSKRAVCPYCTGRKVLAGYNDFASVSPALAQQWDYRKNMPLVPADVSAGSQRSVWWRCEKGHSWRAAVRSRTVGSGCPICAGKQLSLGENDLAALYPALAKQWDAEKNGRLTPRDVLPGTEKKVWRRCERGHSWRLVQDPRGERLPLLRGKTGAAGLQRSCLTAAGACRAVGQGKEPRADAAAGHDHQQPQGLVAV